MSDLQHTPQAPEPYSEQSTIPNSEEPLFYSPLGPISPLEQPSSILECNPETEKKSSWIARKILASMTGRVVMSAYETLRTTGKSVICISPWGDSNPVFLPCIRFRELVIHAVTAGTGGVALIAAPVMGPIVDIVSETLGESILVEAGLRIGFDYSTQVAESFILIFTADHLSQLSYKRIEATGIKTMRITLKYKHTMEDAKLGYYRSSIHRDTSLFSNVKDYFAVEKGWFCPYLFASGRRPIIPRSMTPDIIFCHGPFLGGDYKIGMLLLNDSASVINLCGNISERNYVPGTPPPLPPRINSTVSLPGLPAHVPASVPIRANSDGPPPLPPRTSLVSRFHVPHLHDLLPHASPTPVPNPIAQDAQSPRRLVMLIVGIKPHRKIWTTSARPGESIINYTLLNNCPAIVLPARPGAPLLACNTLTLEQIHKLQIPDEQGGGGEKFKGVVTVLTEYLDLCVEWDRVALGLESRDTPENERHAPRSGYTKDHNIGWDIEHKRKVMRNAITLLLIAAVCSKDSKEAQKEVDVERAGLVIFRIP